MNFLANPMFLLNNVLMSSSTISLVTKVSEVVKPKPITIAFVVGYHTPGTLLITLSNLFRTHNHLMTLLLRFDR